MPALIIVKKQNSSANRFYSLEKVMTTNQIEHLLLEKTKDPHDQDQPSKKKQLEITFKQILNRIRNPHNKHFKSRLAKFLGIPEDHKYFESINKVKAIYSRGKTIYAGPKGSKEYIFQKAVFSTSIAVLRDFVADPLMRDTLLFSLYTFLINSFHPMSFDLKTKKNVFQTQIYFYQKLALLVRYLFVSQGSVNRVFYQGLMNRIRDKHLSMMKTSKKNQRKVVKWVL